MFQCLFDERHGGLLQVTSSSSGRKLSTTEGGVVMYVRSFSNGTTYTVRFNSSSNTGEASNPLLDYAATIGWQAALSALGRAFDIGAVDAVSRRSLSTNSSTASISNASEQKLRTVAAKL
jgi:hypothetical protein